jgi:hypothetical protein
MRKTFFLILLSGWTAAGGACAQETAAAPGAGRIFSYTEGGVLAGNSDNRNSAPFLFHSSLNYAFGRQLSAGLGAGVEFLKETHLPVMANVLFSFGRREAVRPFVRLQGGYLVALENKTSETPVYPDTYPYVSYYPSYQTSEMDARGGWMLSPSAGVIFYTKQQTGIALSAGYRHQTLRYAAKNDYSIQVEQNRLSLTLGLIF